MKKFRDLQPGDKIYYWDKGKLHEQIVHESTIKNETYMNYWGEEVTREVLHLVAGKNRRTDVKLYRSNYSEMFFGNMRRFACLEAALCRINERKSHYEYRLNRLERRVNSYRNCVNKCNEALKKYEK